MVSKGKTQNQIAEYFGLKDRFVIQWLLSQERIKENSLAAGIIPLAQGNKKK